MPEDVLSVKEKIASVVALLNAKLAIENSHDWETVLGRAEYVPVAYTWGMVSYQSAYTEEHVDQFIDLSMVLYHEGKPVGVWPFNIRFANGIWACGSNNGPVYPPLFIKGIFERTKKRITDACLDAIHKLCIVTQQHGWNSAESIGPSGVGLWHRRIMEQGAAVNRIAHELFVDLSLTSGDFHTSIRKSYRPLISKGNKLWQLIIHDRIGQNVFDEFRNLHAAVSGRITRSLKTWNLQEHAINRGEAFLVVLRDNSGLMVGGGLFHISRTEGLYAVGAYDRDLFDKPLGHVVQMKAIDYMKSIGLRWYKLGERFYPADNAKPNDKELSISYFKEGFATHMFVKVHVEIPFTPN